MPTFHPRLTALLLGFALSCGCGGEHEESLGRRPVALDKVPADVMAAAKKEVPGVDFQDAWSNHVKGQDAVHSYEIRGRAKADGKVREVRVGLNGAILETE